MTLKRTVLAAVIAWLALITALHCALNWNWLRTRESAVKVGFLPVTCHLTCPVTDFINRQLSGAGLFEPKRFHSWPELKEAFLSGYTKATFILAPMAMKLREEGVPIKIVYLGHRDGTAMMVHEKSEIRRIEELRGKRIAVPNRFSNQSLLVFKALKDRGLSIKDVQVFELPPPDMPAALYSRSVDAITSGEPFMGQTELDGYGRVLYLTRDVWPGFISCVLAVHEDLIRRQRGAVQRLVDGIARSGKWLDQDSGHRMDAAKFVGRNYYNQNPRLLTFVLSKPPDRVKYTRLEPLKRDFDEIMELGIESGILKGTIRFEDYVDPSFAAATQALEPYAYRPANGR